jgi:hypothetical protein
MNELEEPGKLLASVTHDNAFALEHTPAKGTATPDARTADEGGSVQSPFIRMSRG